MATKRDAWTEHEVEIDGLSWNIDYARRLFCVADISHVPSYFSIKKDSVEEPCMQLSITRMMQITTNGRADNVYTVSCIYNPRYLKHC